MLLGCHVSGSGSMLQIASAAQEQGMGFFQIFFGNPHKISDRKKISKDDADAFKSFMTEHGMRFVSHFPYRLNIASTSAPMHTVQYELNAIAALGGRVVLHTGSYTENKYTNRQVQAYLDSDDLTATQAEKVKQWRICWRTGMARATEAIRQLDRPDGPDYPLLLEPPAGEGKKLAWSFEQLKAMFDDVPEWVGMCLDTCHSFAAGICRYDTIESVDELFRQLELALGDIRRLRCIHFNDSADNFGDMKDNHAVLGTGNIWGDEEHLEGMIHLMRLCKKHEIDMVSECGTEVDFEMMTLVSALIE